MLKTETAKLWLHWKIKSLFLGNMECRELQSKLSYTFQQRTAKLSVIDWIVSPWIHVEASTHNVIIFRDGVFGR